MSGRRRSAVGRLKRRGKGFGAALLAAALLLVGSVGAVWWFAPSPIDAVAWQPPQRPAITGPLTQNGLLLTADLVGQFQGPVGIAFDERGRLYTGTADGKIYRVNFGVQNQKSIEVFAETGGRALGLAFDAPGNLLVADERRGLLSVDKQGRITVLASEVAGVPLLNANSLAVARDGTVYFSTSTTRPLESDLLLEWLEAKPTGRLVAYDPKTKTTRLLLDKLYYARGVALTPAQDAVLVAESARYRVARYWLKGPDAGKRDNWIENLPGFPAGLATEPEKIYLTVVEPRNDNVDRAQPNPAIKNLLAKLPASWVRGNEKGYGLVLVLDSQGTIRTSLQDPTGRLNRLTSVAENGSFLYLGSTAENGIGRYRLPSVTK